MPHHDHATHDQPWHGHDEDVPEEFKFTQEFWDDRYGSAGRLWSGQPNAQLVEQASGLEPGEALDAGCGMRIEPMTEIGRASCRERV